jgi:hypothetical protein
MNNFKRYLFFFVLLLNSCSNNTFDSDKWKTDKEAQYYMLDDIVENKRLIGKSKDEIIQLLDTVYMKGFKKEEDEWGYIIGIPGWVPVTQTPIVWLQLEFKDNQVIKTYVR